jgi:vancomycin resistance protein YoaR
MLTPRPVSPRHHLPRHIPRKHDPNDHDHQPARKKPSFGRTVKLFFMHLIGWPIVLLVLLALLAEAGVLVLLYGEQDYANRIYPNISIRGLDMSNHTPDTALLALNKRYQEFLAHPIEIRYGEYSWYPTAQAMGVTIHFDDAIKQAMTIGRTDTRMENTRTVATVWQDGTEIALQITVDQHKIQQYLREIANMVNIPSRNADVALQGEHLIITPEQAGMQVLVDETVQDITAALQKLEPRQGITLRTRTVTPVVRDTDIAAVVREISALLAEPITITSNEGSCVAGCTWSWSTAKIANWLQLVRGSTPDGRPTISVELDQTGIRNALLPLVDVVRLDGSLPRVNWNDGNMTIFQAGTPGRGLDIALAQSAINRALTSDDGSRTLDLPMTDIPPPVTADNLASLGITTPIATGVSSFINSQQYRITNIRAGANRMHGILIRPGAEFSFNDNLGAVDASGGFVQGSAIVNNRTQQEWGGGLCQVSTTMFRAAFWGGLPITERHEHDFRIGWYEELGEPPGLDAAIFTGADNVRFINDTGGWLLIQTWADLNRQRLFITLYGPAVQRRVDMNYAIIRQKPAPTESKTVEDPSLPAGTFKQTDWAQPGMDVEVYRTVWQNGVVLRQDTFASSFQPWPNVFVRGTGQ